MCFHLQLRGNHTQASCSQRRHVAGSTPCKGAVGSKGILQNLFHAAINMLECCQSRSPERGFSSGGGRPATRTCSQANFLQVAAPRPGDPAGLSPEGKVAVLTSCGIPRTCDERKGRVADNGDETMDHGGSAPYRVGGAHNSIHAVERDVSHGSEGIF